MASGRGKSTSLPSRCFSSKLGAWSHPRLSPTVNQRACVLTTPTCVFCPARPFVSFCGCTQLCSFHNASPVSPPSSPACVSSPACSSATGSQSEMDPPLARATTTTTTTICMHEFMNRVWKYAQCQSLQRYLLLHPRDRRDLWPFVLYSPPERCCQLLQTGYCSAERRKKNYNQPWKKSQGDVFKALERSQMTNLQYLVLSPKVFFFIGITVWKLVDVDPELLYFLFDLQHTTTSVQWCGIVSKMEVVEDHSISDSTFCFFLHTSAGVRQSALANTGTILTFSCRAFIHSTSRGRRLQHMQTCVSTCELYLP